MRVVLLPCLLLAMSACDVAPDTATSNAEFTDFSLRAAMGGKHCMSADDCPASKVCVDDPSDTCTDGVAADCPGICVNEQSCNTNARRPDRYYVGHSPEECSLINFACPVGMEHFSDACGCGCALSTMEETCGDVTCGRGTVCCNASCGICTPPDGVCIQLACL